MKNIGIRDDRDDRSESAPVNMVPLLNLFTVLIPFLLTSVVFVQIQFLHLYLPVEASGEEAPSGRAEALPPLNLVVKITHESFTVDAAQPIRARGAAIPRSHGEDDLPDTLLGRHLLTLPDFARLEDYLAEAKTAYPQEHSATIIALDDIRYQTLLAVMDCCRLEGRFPVISFSKWEQ